MENRFNILTILIDIVVWLVGVMLGLRIILKFFGASQQADFVTWVYRNSEPLIEPFKGMFPSPTIDGIFTLEFSAIFALIVYAIAGSFLAYFTQLIESGFGFRKKKKKEE